ncbi:MAG: 23S rRNA (adenine(2503)-C(2))-methyltransferase RlmN [Aquificota bacterium]|nr:23S rRNA (adenine(2503)-C(2))-methyltransferase RlmN [Aquificota bacterium]
MKVLTEYNLTDLQEELTSSGFEHYRARQILKWVYSKFVFDFDLMTDLPKDMRRTLKETFRVHTLDTVDRVTAPDSVKYLFRTRDGHLIETVLIKERDHLTLCVSTQIGCAVGCTFCATALDGLIRNLRTSEIVDQYLKVAEDIGGRIRNVVFMGMGEPLANYENLRKAVEIMVSPWGINLSKRRVTVSTSGILSQIRRMMEDDVLKDINLAVSINATTQRLRESIMPLTKTNTLKDLMDLLKRYPLRPYRRITLEYVLIKDLNDSEEDALRLARLIGKHKKRFKVNLIPFNPDPNLPYERPPLDRVLRFQKVLWERGISTFVRFSKGVDVFGACGQLRSRRPVVRSLNHEEPAQVGDGAGCNSLSGPPDKGDSRSGL